MEAPPPKKSRTRNRRRSNSAKNEEGAPQSEEHRGKRRPRATSGGSANGRPQTKAREEALVEPQPEGGGAAAPHSGARTSSTTRAHMTEKRFDSLDGVSEPILRALSQVMGYELMTKVQAQALPVCKSGRDVVAKAKTGTGKTIAFMIPALEKSVKSMNSVGGLVISPTRELAQQTMEEGKLLSRFYPPSFGLACLVGGVPIKKDYSALKRNCNVVVATPGRLNDHLENTQGFAQSLSELKVLVFDEADQLLDMGFRPAIEQILRAIEPSAATRQTLLFSATLPADVASIAKLAMRSDYAFVDTVGVEDQTHADVPQLCVVSDSKEAQSAELGLRLLKATAADKKHKIIVFFTTARLTQFYAELFKKSAMFSTDILEIHSRKSQSHREKISKAFRESSGGVTMFTSDVSARGMDYPDVNLIIQFGAPTDSHQYVHRLGRTARGDGARGGGCLLLANFEKYFLHELKSLPVMQDKPLFVFEEKESKSVFVGLQDAAKSLPKETVGSAYQAWLGYHNSNLRKLKWSKDQLVQEANDWAIQVAQAPSPPPLQAKTIGKMGLKGTQGLVIDRQFNGGGGGGRGGGGRGSGGGRGRRN